MRFNISLKESRKDIPVICCGGCDIANKISVARVSYFVGSIVTGGSFLAPNVKWDKFRNSHGEWHDESE